jgi:hypothetical protein
VYIRVKTLKSDLSQLDFPNAKNCIDGSMGKAVEQELVRQGFKVSSGVIDLPDLQLEIKTRKSSSDSPHTVGTMTHDDILNTSWKDTSFRQKLQSQFRVTIDTKTGKVSEQVVIHFRDDPDIDRELERSYEDARIKLRIFHTLSNGNILKDYTIRGDDRLAFLEYKDGSSYAFRIDHRGMKRFINMANTAPVFNSLFSYT